MLSDLSFFRKHPNISFQINTNLFFIKSVSMILEFQYRCDFLEHDNFVCSKSLYFKVYKSTKFEERKGGTFNQVVVFGELVLIFILNVIRRQMFFSCFLLKNIRVVMVLVPKHTQEGCSVILVLGTHNKNQFFFKQKTDSA